MTINLHYQKLRDLAERLGPFIGICREARLIRTHLLPDLLHKHTNALALLLPDVGEIIENWLNELDELKNDLSYRERALRAERHLRDVKRELRKLK